MSMEENLKRMREQNKKDPNYIDPETLKKARVAAEALKKELELLIIGKHLKPWKCCCGAISHNEAEAVKIRTPWTLYQIAMSSMWSVLMRDIDSKRDWDYSNGIEFFLKEEEIKNMFEKHFGNLNVRLT